MLELHREMKWLSPQDAHSLEENKRQCLSKGGMLQSLLSALQSLVPALHHLEALMSVVPRLGVQAKGAEG